MTRTLLLPMLLLMLVLVQNGESIWLNLPKSGYKCVMEELQNNVVAVGEYNAVIFEGLVLRNPTVSIAVKSPHGNLIYHKENVTEDEFAFTSTESGLYLTCFLPDNPDTGGKLAVNIDWKIGAAAKDWDSVAKKEKIEGVELELRKLEGHVEAIRDNLVYRKSREANMREVSETTNSRVAWCSISSSGICILASGAQLWYLTRFFQNNKLIYIFNSLVVMS
ncbi:transmembrane emp24 domain-containing protein p24delta4-like [Bidens hawaiensis]|uniref:transmembrane emp24 domain-containing protein p24delta4-like n=1 Tax=Bidens hawaiensis TaxID=980011 RepID=UPI00404B6D7D